MIPKADFFQSSEHQPKKYVYKHKTITTRFIICSGNGNEKLAYNFDKLIPLPLKRNKW